MRIVELLEECAVTLQPFAETFDAGARKWNGSAYVLSSESQVGDSNASAWSATCRTAAELFRVQDRPSDAQLGVLRHLLFGGMGSFQDFSLSTEHWGARAQAANQRLEQLRKQLFDCMANVK
jgi:hypothetical protein